VAPAKGSNWLHSRARTAAKCRLAKRRRLYTYAPAADIIHADTCSASCKCQRWPPVVASTPLHACSKAARLRRCAGSRSSRANTGFRRYPSALSFAVAVASLSQGAGSSPRIIATVCTHSSHNSVMEHSSQCGHLYAQPTDVWAHHSTLQTQECSAGIACAELQRHLSCTAA
jgi:hypothetical protein